MSNKPSKFKQLPMPPAQTAYMNAADIPDVSEDEANQAEISPDESQMQKIAAELEMNMPNSDNIFGPEESVEDAAANLKSTAPMAKKQMRQMAPQRTLPIGKK